MKKNYLTGVVTGVLATTMVLGGVAFAATPISAYVNDDIKIAFDGKVKQLPDGYSTVIYQGHTYVPAAYVAGQLGASVSWDDSTKTVNINTSQNPSLPYLDGSSSTGQSGSSSAGTGGSQSSGNAGFSSLNNGTFTTSDGNYVFTTTSTGLVYGIMETQGKVRNNTDKMIDAWVTATYYDANGNVVTSTHTGVHMEANSTSPFELFPEKPIDNAVSISYRVQDSADPATFE